jgi:formiminoglutamate deiminase
MYHCELAYLGGDQAQRDVLVRVAGDRIAEVSPGRPAPAGAHRLAGLTLPGLVNTHSHVFHRAIRGRAQSGVADFWAWREVMYAAAAALDPDRMYRLALATYAEMALAGITAVGEFHYLHHDPDGRRHADPNEMGRAVIRAATDAGIRITLLDTCYLQAGVDGAPLTGVQRRFDDGSVQAWAARVDELAASVHHPLARVGAAVHSVRAVPRAAIRPMAEFAAQRQLVLHAHVSEQPAENEACHTRFGLTPVQLLEAEGSLGSHVTAVHATHLTAADIAALGRTGTAISMCPTTERNLADGAGHAVALAAAGSPICLGSDGHAEIDLLAEGRAIEMNERLVTGRRGHLTAGRIAHALTAAGADSLGWNASRIAPGALADLATVDLDTVRTAGARSGDALAQVIFAAGAADVRTVIVGGVVVVDDGVHLAVPHTGRELAAAIDQVLGGTDR